MNELLAQVRLDQRERWGKGERVLAETYLERHPELGADEETTLDLIYSEVLLRAELGETPRAEEYAARFPRHADLLRAQLELEELLRAVAVPGQVSAPTLPHELPPETVGGGAGGPSPESASALPAIPGYEILGRLGVGGLGIVYKARQLSLDRVVALKMLRHEGAGEADDLARMQREARAATRLNHAHLVQVYEFGKHNSRPYFTMEYVPGGSLRERLAAGPLAQAEAVRLLEKLARALDAVHREKIVHRDLKPGNVLLAAGDEPKVADFGLAKQLGGEASLNPSGALVGTVSYMAPEQAAGKNREVGPAADVWALGAILYECLTGKPAFSWTDLLDTLDRVCHAEPERPTRLRPGLPRDLETICLKCLEKEPHRRYLGALELAEDLSRFRAGKPIQARPRPWYERARLWLWRRPVLVAGGALLLLAAAIAPFVLPRPDSRPEPAPAARPTPEQERRAAEATLGLGKPYTFAGDEPLPGPFRWVFGGGGLLGPRANPSEKCFALETVRICLLELVADPQQDRYRFSARVRHDDAAGDSLVGLYFGYRESRSAAGLLRAGFYTLGFADRGKAAGVGPAPEGKRVGSVWLHYHPLIERPGDQVYIGRGPPLKVGKVVKPAVPASVPTPWCNLCVTVTPEEIEAVWEGAPGQPGQSFRVSTKTLQMAAGWQGKIHPELAVIPADFRPRQGLGLYVRAGKASFREVALGPLPVGK